METGSFEANCDMKVIFYIVCITAPQHNLGLAVDSRRIKQETRASWVSIFLSEAVVGSEILMESALIIQVMLASIESTPHLLLGLIKTRHCISLVCEMVYLIIPVDINSDLDCHFNSMSRLFKPMKVPCRQTRVSQINASIAPAEPTGQR